MRIMLHLSRDDIREQLPYELICTTRESSVWQTGKRRRKWIAEFSPAEREAATDIFRRSHSMFLTKGVPEEGILMSAKTYNLWQKIGIFCLEI